MSAIYVFGTARQTSANQARDVGHKTWRPFVQTVVSQIKSNSEWVHKVQ